MFRRARPDPPGAASDSPSSESSESSDAESIPRVDLRGTRKPRPGQAVTPVPMTPANQSSSSPATVAVHSMPPISPSLQPLARVPVDTPTAIPTPTPASIPGLQSPAPASSSVEGRQRRRRERAAASSAFSAASSPAPAARQPQRQSQRSVANSNAQSASPPSAAASPSLRSQQVRPRQTSATLPLPPAVGGQTSAPRRTRTSSQQPTSRQAPRARSLSSSRSRSLSRSPSRSPSPERHANRRREHHRSQSESPTNRGSHPNRDYNERRDHRDRHHDRHDEDSRHDPAIKSPSSSKWKSPLMLLGSLAAAAFCVDRFVPKDVDYGEKTGWDGREEPHRHRGDYDRDRERERERDRDRFRGQERPLERDRAERRDARDPRESRREVVIVDDRERARQAQEDVEVDELPGDRRRVRRMARSGYVPPPPVNMTAPTPPQNPQGIPPRMRGVTFQDDSRDPRDPRYSRDPRDPRDGRDPRDPRDPQDPRNPKNSREFRDLRGSRDIRYEDPNNDSFTSLREQRRSRNAPANSSTTATNNNASRRATWDPATAALATAATVGSAAAVSRAMSGADEGQSDMRRRQSARDSPRIYRDLRGDPRDRDIRDRDPRDSRDLRDPRDRDPRSSRDSRDFRDSRDSRERAEEVNPRWSLYSQGNTPLNLSGPDSNPATRDPSRARDASRARDDSRVRDERAERDERRASRRLSRPGHSKDARRFDATSAAAVAATAALATGVGAAALSDRRASVQSGSQVPDPRDPRDLRDAREPREETDGRSTAASQRPPILTRTSPPSANGEFPKSKILKVGRNGSLNSVDSVDSQKSQKSQDSLTDSSTSSVRPAQRRPPAPVDESSESLHVHSKAPRYPTRQQRGPPGDIRMSGALGGNKTDRKLSFGDEDDVITVEYENEKPAAAPRSRFRPDRSQETITGSLKSALKGGGERAYPHPDTRRFSSDSAATGGGLGAAAGVTASPAAAAAARRLRSISSASSHSSDSDGRDSPHAVSVRPGGGGGGGNGGGRPPVGDARFDESPPSSPSGRHPAIQRTGPIAPSSLTSFHSDSTRSLDSRLPPPSSRTRPAARNAPVAATAAAASVVSALSQVSSRHSSHSSDSDDPLSPVPVRPGGGGGGGGNNPSAAASVKFNESLLSTRLSDDSDSEIGVNGGHGESQIGSKPPTMPEGVPMIVTVGPPESDSESDDDDAAVGAPSHASGGSSGLSEAALSLHKQQQQDASDSHNSESDDDSFTVRNRYKMMKLKDRLAKAVSSVGGSTRSPSPSLASTELSKSSEEAEQSVLAERIGRSSRHGDVSPPLRRSALSLGHHSATGPHSSSNTTPQSDSEEESHVSTVDLRDANAYKSRRSAMLSTRPVDKSEDDLAYGAYGGYGGSRAGSEAYSDMSAPRSSYKKNKPAYASDSDSNSDRDTVRDGSSVRALEKYDKYSSQASKEAAADERFRARQAEIEHDRASSRAERDDKQRDWDRLRMHDKASIKSHRDSLLSGGDSDVSSEAPVRSAYSGRPLAPARSVAESSTLSLSSVAPSASAVSAVSGPSRRGPSPPREPKSRLLLELEIQERQARIDEQKALERAAKSKAREQTLREADAKETARAARQRRKREIDDILEKDYA